MSTRLYEMVTDKKSELTEDYIKEMFDLLVQNEKGLSDYIKDFIIDNKTTGAGEYSCDDRIMKINPEIIMDVGYPEFPDFDKKILTLHVLKHEVEHAKALKRLYEGRNDIESVINRYAHVDYIKRYNLPFALFVDEKADYLSFKRHQEYEIDPGERIAEIKACQFLVNLLKNQRRTKDLLIERSLLYFSYIRGYRDNGYYLDAPTYTYLMNMGMFRELYILKKVVDKTKYCLDTRVMMGLPITYDERENVLLRKVRLQRKKLD